MKLLRLSTLALACVLASACKDRHEPVKPTVPAPSGMFVDR
ncbi:MULTISPECIES: hypothetical protein [Massilia]|uniref:Lipoprotein n=1 Tax=Massilia haematophila TaxID=457923 RepID=A0ABV7PHZ8_9BURK|nr:hypothetical protein [Massilia sp.]